MNVFKSAEEKWRSAPSAEEDTIKTTCNRL